MLIEPTPENEHDRRWGWLFPVDNSLLEEVKKILFESFQCY